MLFADRTSAATLRANQLRLYYSSVEYTLVVALRRLGLAGTALAKAQCTTIRLTLLKIGARIRVTVRKVWLGSIDTAPSASDVATAPDFTVSCCQHRTRSRTPRFTPAGEEFGLGRALVFVPPPATITVSSPWPTASRSPMPRPLGVVLLAVLTAACTGIEAETPKRDTAAERAPATAPIAAGGTIRGTVRAVIPVESYLHLRLETANGEVWTAVNQSQLSVGATVTICNVLLMEQFASPTLKRTFARSYFGSLEPVAPAPYGAVATAAGPTPASVAWTAARMQASMARRRR